MARVTDPVCGMEIDSATAPARVEHGSHTHYFCSADCRDRFLAAPAKYGDAHAAAGHGGEGGHGEHVEMERHEPPFTTKGGITAPKFGSAGSGGLEYEPLPERHDG